IVGFTGASKSTTVELIAEKLLNAGQTGFDAYGGEFHENAFWSITMGCEYDETYPCNCKGYETDEGRFPMTLLVPHNFVLTDYDGNSVENICKVCSKGREECEATENSNHSFELKPNALDFYNDNRFSIWEWRKFNAQIKNTGLLEYNRNNPPQRPQGSPKVPWIRIVKLPKARNSPPKVSKGMWDYEENEEIRKIFLRELKFSREEGHKRIIVFNIGFWNVEFQRMKTLQILIYSLQLAKERVFTPPMIFDRVRKDWTPKELTYDKVFMLFRELGEVANQNIKSDESGFSTFVKKALVWYIRKGRQLGCSMIGDMQRSEDVMTGIRSHADWFHIKNSPTSLLGDSWKWLSNENMTGKIDKKREQILLESDWNYDKANAIYPRIQDLSKARGYAVSKEDVIRLTTYVMPAHHHWDPDHADHWSMITGINFKLVSQTKEEKQEEEKVQVVDNSVEQVGIILSMMKDKKLKAKAIEEYKLTNESGKWSWESFVYPIYKEWLSKNIITTNRVRPTGSALKIWYNIQLRKNKE
ncbi:MAG: hypothetical protein IIC67_10325, partial [Thaumarchaeota archaeon]|nr:hypothetical protein [Nitrososphaerota archaeon]